MKIVIAPDSFKGTLSANEICEQVSKAAKEVFHGCETLSIPIADGGEGTVDCLVDALDALRIEIDVKNALLEDAKASYAIFNENNAIIEMAAASGLPQIPESKRDVFASNTYGSGQLILNAIDKGCKSIYIGLGGSATNDGGLGCLQAFGVRFLDKDGQELPPLPIHFESIASIDTSNINTSLQNVQIIIISDVKNPLLGKNGATYAFGRQKGANEDAQATLERGMKHVYDIIERTQNVCVKEQEGAGAAGGLGAALLAFTNATMNSGVESILDVLHFDEKIQGADLVVTGEGMMDYQSAYGKVAYGVGKRCQKNKVACFAIVGAMGEDAQAMFAHGIDSIMTTTNKVTDFEDVCKHAKELCYSAAIRSFRLIQMGMQIK